VADPKRKRQAVELGEDEVEAILAEVAEWSPGGKRGGPFPLRARYTVAFETALRPATLDAIMAPADYRKGSAVLRIRDEIDKARFGREVPLSPRARAVLDALCPDRGPIFGAAEIYKRALKPAAGRAAAAGTLDPEKARLVSPYDLRHARLTQWAVTSGGNLPGLMHLAGHKHATTTSKYIKAGRREAQRVIVAATAAGAAQGGMGDMGGLPAAPPESIVPRLDLCALANVATMTRMGGPVTIPDHSCPANDAETIEEAGTPRAFRFQWGNTHGGSTPPFRTRRAPARLTDAVTAVAAHRLAPAARED
jgi:hypothetical protein